MIPPRKTSKGSVRGPTMPFLRRSMMSPLRETWSLSSLRKPAMGPVRWLIMYDAFP